MARIARDLHNKTYQNKLEIDSFLEIEKTIKKESSKSISIKLKTLQNMVKIVGRK